MSYKHLLTFSQHVVPVFLGHLNMTKFCDRVQLIYIVNCIARWMQGPFRIKVAERFESLWRYLQQSRSTGRGIAAILVGRTGFSLLIDARLPRYKASWHFGDIV